MYEPSRQPVRTPRPAAGRRTRTAEPAAERGASQPSRTDHLQAQLAGHLAALLAVTDELRGAGPSEELDEAAREIAERVTELSPTGAPVRIWEGSRPGAGHARVAALHQHAHTIAGRVLVVAASRQDTATAMLACRRMDAHALALNSPPVPA
ncbi:SCO4983 family protein [Wenjunlia tyrosinilytica]|uniref:Uncharacterized protein n=1 Tax=Wenjunlia tyrosinilytica TaxID=1544741 RepID=A0A917ZJ80_9ACTN|nr:hypothetical protein [Wenjunlia tyrosinilytica]GGO82989.1 hypothetical protein GCM10012280_10880 [Wenjunlia tyrosinilytica]